MSNHTNSQTDRIEEPSKGFRSHLGASTARSAVNRKPFMASMIVGLVLTAACTPLSVDRSTTVSAGEVGAAVAGLGGRTSVRSRIPKTTTTTAPTTTSTTAPATTTTTAPISATPPTTIALLSPTTTVPAAAPVDTYVTPGSRLGVAGCSLFPQNNAFHASVARLPVRSDSAAALAAAGGATTKVRAGFTAGVYNGSRGGYPVNVADSRTNTVMNWTIGAYPYVSDPNGHVLPASPRFEGWPSIAWDRHLLTVDTATCSTSEAFYVIPPWENIFGIWYADSAIKMDLRSNNLPAKGSTTAAGFSLLHGLVRYDEVASGNIDHAVTVTLPEIRKGDVIWPAKYTDGKSTNTALPQMGSWLRLRAGVDLSGLTPQARVVAQAMRDHGAIVGDTGPSGLVINGEPDLRWNDVDLKGLGGLSLADFEVVNPSAMQIDSSLTIR